MAFQNAFSVGPCSVTLYSITRVEPIFEQGISPGNVYSFADPDSELGLTLTVNANGVITLESAGPLQPEKGYSLFLTPSYPLEENAFQLASISFTDEITNAYGFSDSLGEVLSEFAQLIPTAIPNPMNLTNIASSKDGWGLLVKYFPI